MASIPKPKSGDSQINEYSGEWKYFKSLFFLKDQFTPRTSKGNFPKSDDENISDNTSQTLQDVSDDDNECEQEIKDCNTQSSLDNLEHFSSEPSSTRSNVNTPYSSRASSNARKCPKKRSSKNVEDVGQALVQIEKQKLQFLEQKRNTTEEDEDLMFFKSLLPYVRKMSAYEKLEYRMKVMKLTQEFINPNQNSHATENTTKSNSYDTTSRSHHSAARNFYNDAETHLNLSEPPDLYNAFNLLNH